MITCYEYNVYTCPIAETTVSYEKLFHIRKVDGGLNGLKTYIRVFVNMLYI